MATGSYINTNEMLGSTQELMGSKPDTREKRAGAGHIGYTRRQEACFRRLVLQEQVSAREHQQEDP